MTFWPWRAWRGDRKREMTPLVGARDGRGASTHGRCTFGHIVVVAGPTCVGKSTLMSQLLQGELRDLTDSLGMESGVVYELFHAAEWKRLVQASRRAVLLHFELTRPQFQKRGEHDSALQVLGNARRVSFLTLWERPEIIESRFRVRVRQVLVEHVQGLRLWLAWRRHRRFQERRPFVENEERMWWLYRQWFGFAERFSGAPHQVVRSSAPHEFRAATAVVRELPLWNVVEPSASVGVRTGD